MWGPPFWPAVDTAGWRIKSKFKERNVCDDTSLSSASQRSQLSLSLATVAAPACPRDVFADVTGAEPNIMWKWNISCLPVVCRGCWSDAAYQKCACLFWFCPLCFISVAVDIIRSVPLNAGLMATIDIHYKWTRADNASAVLSIAFMVCVLSYLIRNRKGGRLQRKELGHLFRSVLPLKAFRRSTLKVS